MNPMTSSFAISDVARLVAAEYGVGTPSKVRLMNSGVNDTYAISVGQTSYALRFYGRNRWYISGPDDYRFEHGLLAHLQSAGVPVSVPISRRNGDTLGALTTPSGEHYFSLFSWAPGTPGHTETLTNAQAHLIGQTLASIHVAADSYQAKPGHSRYTLDERTLLDTFVRELEPSLRHDDPSDVRFIRAQIADIRRRIRAFDPGPGGWGIVHGDVQGLNHHFAEDGHITWLDFDFCGYGWRTYDIAYYYTRIPEPVREPVIKGYESVRALSRTEHEMLPTMGKLAWIREGDRSKQLVKHLRNPYMSYL
jgi:Ser/Thr protein kinase RdoA (MazF antagonist)